MMVFSPARLRIQPILAIRPMAKDRGDLIPMASVAAQNDSGRLVARDRGRRGRQPSCCYKEPDCGSRTAGISPERVVDGGEPQVEEALR
jgi:hypothetical protein